MRFFTVVRAFTSVVVLLVAIDVLAQSGSQGSIEGVVQDATGAVIPGVAIAAEAVATGIKFSALSNDAGLFRFLVLQPGTYKLSAEASRFARTIRDVDVTPGARVFLSIQLQIAPHKESLTVTSLAPLTEPTRTAVTSSLNETAIATLPVNGRNFTDFVALAPGVIRGPGGSARFGGQNFGDAMLVDSANDSNPLLAQNFSMFPYQFSLSAISEFQVNVNGYTAEFGRATSGVTNAVTKAGTNELHGTGFWYFRDKGLNAADPVRKFNGLAKEPLHIHQFGIELGGPLRKNKVFFLAAYDAQRRKLNNGTFLNLPAGFQLSSNPAVAVFQQRALDYLEPRALPYTQSNDEDTFFGRLDWHLAPMHMLTARWNSARLNNLNATNSGPQNSYEHTGTAVILNDSAAMSLTSFISSSAVNVAHLNYLQLSNSPGANSVNPQANVFEAGQLVLTVGRAVSGVQQNVVHQAQFSDVISISRGRHAVKFGAEGIVTAATNVALRNFYGNYRFNSLESFGRSISGIAAPQVGDNYLQSFLGPGQTDVNVHPDSHDFDGFIEDEWQLRSGLTLNAGLRYDVQLMATPTVKNPSAALAAAALNTSFVPIDFDKFGPRLGIAWSPFPDQKLVVRSNYGVFSGWLPGNVSARPHYQNGISVQTRTFMPGAPSGAFIPTYPNTVCGPPESDGTPPTCAAPVPGIDTLMVFSPAYTQAYSEHVNLGFEYLLQQHTALSATYLMVAGKHMPRWRDINLSAPTPATIGIAGTNTVLTYNRYSSPRPISGFDRLLALESSASSNYHGVAIQLNKRFAHNFQLLAGYTLSKVIDDHPELLAFDPGGPQEAEIISDPYYPSADRGLGVADARHRFVLSGQWELRYADHLPHAARIVLGGWETSGIIAVQSGLPYTGGVSFDLNNDGNNLSDRSPGEARNTHIAPTTASWDQRLTRNLQIREHLRMQIIWEAFNLLNRANYTDPRATQFARSSSPTVCGIAASPCLVPQSTGSNAFGIPADSTGPRVMQFAAKLVF